MQHLVILLAFFAPHADIETAVTRTVTAQECAAVDNEVSTDDTGTRMYVTCESLDTANAKLQTENCVTHGVDVDGYVTYRCNNPE